MVYKANVKKILLEGDSAASSSASASSSSSSSTAAAAGGEPQRAVGVQLADGRVFRGRSIISNATRWDTFEGMIGQERMPQSEHLFRCALLAGSSLGWQGRSLVVSLCVCLYVFRFVFSCLVFVCLCWHTSDLPCLTLTNALVLVNPIQS